jgi:hypothetical protein
VSAHASDGPVDAVSDGSQSVPGGSALSCGV